MSQDVRHCVASNVVHKSISEERLPVHHIQAFAPCPSTMQTKMKENDRVPVAGFQNRIKRELQADEQAPAQGCPLETLLLLDCRLRTPDDASDQSVSDLLRRLRRVAVTI